MASSITNWFQRILDVTYEEQILYACKEQQKWMELHKCELPESAWDFPAGSPVWQLNLSLAQAECVLVRLRRMTNGVATS